MGSRSTSDYIRIPMFDGREGDLFRKKYRVLQQLCNGNITVVLFSLNGNCKIVYFFYKTNHEIT